MYLSKPDFDFDYSHPPIPRVLRPDFSRVNPKPDVNQELVPIPDELQVLNIYNDLPLPYRENLLLRPRIIHKLLNAQQFLPVHFKFVILDAYRTRSFQEKLHTYYATKFPNIDEKYVADPRNSHRIPPHTTGAVVDLTLSYKGVPLALGTDFDEFSVSASIDYLEHFDHLDSRNETRLRRMMYQCLTREGFAPEPAEWWHWSYGDQMWAAFYGEREYLYQEIVEKVF